MIDLRMRAHGLPHTTPQPRVFPPPLPSLPSPTPALSLAPNPPGGRPARRAERGLRSRGPARLRRSERGFCRRGTTDEVALLLLLFKRLTKVAAAAAAAVAAAAAAGATGGAACPIATAALAYSPSHIALHFESAIFNLHEHVISEILSPFHLHEHVNCHLSRVSNPLHFQAHRLLHGSTF
jgi:hypothetical protein